MPIASVVAAAYFVFGFEFAPTTMPIIPIGMKKVPAMQASTTPKNEENHAGTLGANVSKRHTTLTSPKNSGP
jgi:hypothetical protein